MQQKKENNLFEQLDFVSIIKDVLREWWVILLLSISVSLLTNVFVNYTYEPQYTASCTFVVTAKGMNANIYQNLTSAKELAVSFSNVLNSNVMKRKIAEDLGVETLNATSTVEILPETNLIELKVTANSSLEAYKMIKSIMENYPSVSDYVISNVVLEVIKKPAIPMSPSNPFNASESMKKAFFISVAVLVFGFAVISFLKDTIKNKREVVEKVDAPLLGTVAHERKAKSLREVKKAKNLSMLIDNPMLSFRFVESNKMMASRVRSQLDKHGYKILMLTSVIENEGKSTVAANLALSLVQENKKVLLVDCDFRKPAQYKIFECKEEEVLDFPQLLSKGGKGASIIKQYGDTGLYTIFNKKGSSNMERIYESGALQKVLEIARDKMDYIILDTSPMALVSDTEELAQLADATILVIRQDMVLAKDINDAIDVLERANGNMLGCIFNDEVLGVVERVGHYGYGYRRYGYGYGRYGYGRGYGKSN